MPRILHVVTALPQHEKSPPTHPGHQQPASPTLTNPDYILPSGGLSAIHSPPRVTRRPPSPGYLREESPSPPAAMARKERHHLGLMSRKMMLLRSRTASNGGHINGKSTQGTSSSLRPPDVVPASPVLQDVGNLAPEQPECLPLPRTDRQIHSGGSSSSDLSELNGFLAQYTQPDSTSDDEALDGNEHNRAPTRLAGSSEADYDRDEERKKQQQEEYNSAILSKRAEQILANAKKRLNVMEGNLRGARDLVAPLTAANLKRATSLGSAQHQVTYARRQQAVNIPDYNTQNQQWSRKLVTQASSPTIGRDYQGHARGFSENDMLEGPYTASDQPHHNAGRNTRGIASHVDLLPPHGLRGSRSHDSLGGNDGIGYAFSRDRPLHARDSPESTHLETLQESEERWPARNSENGMDDFSDHGLGIYRPSSTTSDLREQMSSLKGKISTLKERAREDSLRRRSQSSLRNASPFNNALGAAPEFFYTSSANYGSPVLDTNAGVGRTSDSNSPVSPQNFGNNAIPFAGSRNAFAEQAAGNEHGMPQVRNAEVAASGSRNGEAQGNPATSTHIGPPTTHRRTPSGTAIVQAAKKRFSHHQRREGQGLSGAYAVNDHNDYAAGSSSPELSSDQDDVSTTSSHPSPRTDDEYAASEDEVSIYEDAQYEQTAIVAHEDREDAFDYEHFFLLSAMAANSGSRRDSVSSEGSASSVETAKGPVLVGDEEDDDFNRSSDAFPPPTPETPERLREIERNLHQRTLSDGSITTLDTFATAEEDPVSPIDGVVGIFGRGERPSVSPVSSAPRTNPRASSHTSSRSGSQVGTHNPTRADLRPDSRPSTAVRYVAGDDSSSDRADSGVGLPRRPLASSEPPRPPSGLSTTAKPTKAASTGSNVLTPPTSPQLFSRQDPISVAVNALLDPSGTPLGLRNKAILFGVVESLRKVVHQLQEEDEAHYEARVLRRKLDEAKLALDGRNAG